MRVANRAEGEWLRKVKEDKKRNKQRKLWAWEQGQDTDDDDDDDDEVMEEEETVADDIEWDNLENEDALTGISLSLQESRPFSFHRGEGTFGEPVEVVRTIGLPQESIGAGNSVTEPEMSVEVGSSAIAP